MVEIKDIVDRESLEAWLKEKPKNVSQIIVHRSAMRVLPDYWHWAIKSQWAEEGGITILPVLRANITSEVVSYRASQEIPQKLDFAVKESETIAHPVGKFADSLMEKFSSADNRFSYANFIFRGEHEVSSAEIAVNSVLATVPFMKMYAAESDSIYNNIWEQLRSDVLNMEPRLTPYRPALWLRERNPFIDRWKNVKKLLENSKENWSFWIKWYEAALNGEPLNFEMLERIALIPSDDWEKSPAHVNAIIAKIETEFELKAKIAELEGKLLQISSSGRGIGDNQGPPMADEPVAKEIMIIWEPLQELTEEIEKRSPSRERLLEIAKKLKGIVAIAKKLLAGTINTAYDATIVLAVSDFVNVYANSQESVVMKLVQELSKQIEKYVSFFN